MRLLMAAVAALLLAPTAGAEDVRFSTFNASLNRAAAGQLIADLSTPGNQQARNAAETIQRVRPDVILINEFDFDAGGTALKLFQDNYLSVSQNGAAPIVYPYRFAAESNTGLRRGSTSTTTAILRRARRRLRLRRLSGQFGMAVYSRYPIDPTGIRTFQHFLWKDMPGALLPDDPATPAPMDWYSPAELNVFRLSSKSHWDLPVLIGGQVVHFLTSHPTPPVFDGPEDRNGTRNFDEIRFWADYIAPWRSGYIYDDAGGRGGLPLGARFVIAGDQNSDPLDGDSIPGAIQQLLDHPLVNPFHTPESPGCGGAERVAGRDQPDARSDPRFDTADFADSTPGNLRADYVLPSRNIRITSSAASSGRSCPIRSSGSSGCFRSRRRTTGWSGSTR